MGMYAHGVIFYGYRLPALNYNPDTYDEGDEEDWDTIDRWENEHWGKDEKLQIVRTCIDGELRSIAIKDTVVTSEWTNPPTELFILRDVSFNFDILDEELKQWFRDLKLEVPNVGPSWYVGCYWSM